MKMIQISRSFIVALCITTIAASLDAQNQQILKLDSSRKLGVLESMTGNPGGSPITVTIDADAPIDTVFGQWIRNAINGNAVRKGGSAFTTDNAMHPISALDFTDAVLSEIKFGALFSNSANPALITVVIAPTSSTLRTTNLSQLHNVYYSRGAIQRGDFILGIKGLDDALLQHISNIDALTIQAGKCPQLVIQVPAAFADALVKASAGTGEQRARQLGDGSLELLNHSTRAVVYRLEFRGLRLVKLQEGKIGHPSDPGYQDFYRAEFSCSEISLK